VMRLTPSVSHVGVSAQQAPETHGSPCCQANIHDRQRLWSGSVYRACGHCGTPAQAERAPRREESRR
jgi:hypothetical protein